MYYVVFLTGNYVCVFNMYKFFVFLTLFSSEQYLILQFQHPAWKDALYKILTNSNEES